MYARSLLLLLISIAAFAQTGTLRGTVTDESGAIVPGTKVTLNGPGGIVKIAIASGDAVYSFADLVPGAYTLQAAAPDLALAKPLPVAIKAGAQTLNVQLKVVSAAQQVTVEDKASQNVSTDAASNANALVLRGADLDALSDDPEDLQADLLALAGPAAGPNGGQIFVDGFSGGQLPAKDSIREIRINQNPFSPEYDRLGFGRIEILTKPGTDKFKGALAYNFADDFWNSRNPYAAQKAPFSLNEYRGTLSGPISKRASFFMDVERELVDNGSIINGAILDAATLAVIDPYTDTFRTRQRRTTLSPRVDYQLSANHTLTARYRFNRDGIDGAGIGGFNLTSRGTNSVFTNQTVQISETSVIGSAMVNETRFQYFRPVVDVTPKDAGFALQVLGAFTGGGAQTGHSRDAQNTYELQNNTSITRGRHLWRFGIRLRVQNDNSVAPRNFGGTYTFAGGIAPQLDANNRPVLDAAGNPVLVTIQSIERYRRTQVLQRAGLTPAQIRALGGGATQFSVSAGTPGLSVSQTDVGLFVGDDWRVKPNITLNLGLRYEAQTNIQDLRGFAPRIGLAWAPGAKARTLRPKTVLRVGFGMFYDRFPLANTLLAHRFNGSVQQQFVVSDPAILDLYPAIPTAAMLAPFQAQQTVQVVSASLRAPYILQSAFSFERQLPANITMALTYADSHGVHLFRSNDINAPLAGSGVFPYGRPGPILLMESAGLYNQEQFLANVNARVNAKLSLFGSYMLNRARSNTDGFGTYPANPYSSAGEYGPASTDIRHRGTFGGSIDAKWGVRLSPLLAIDGGAPFDITSGTDLYGTTLFTARPGIATDPKKPGVVLTRYGLLDPNPTPGETILGRNFGRGPAQVRMNLRVSKTFGFGAARERSSDLASPARPGATPGPGGGGDRNRGASVFGSGGGPQTTNAGPVNRRFNVTISMTAQNLLNHNNPGPIIGNITSPLFGRANQPAGAGGGGFSESANNRRLELQTRFSF